MRRALLLALLAAPVWGQNLLVNPGFEEGLVGWTVAQEGAGVVEPSATAHDGSASALVMAPYPQPGFWGRATISQDVRVRRGARYCVGAWLLPVADGGGFGLSVSYGAGAYVDLLAYGSPTAWGWQRACFTSSRKYVRVSVWASPGLVAGGGWVDSMDLSEVAQ